MRTLRLTRRAAAAALLLAACGPEPTGIEAPDVSLSVSPAQIQLGQSARLTWSSARASRCSARSEPAGASLAWAGPIPTSNETGLSLIPPAPGAYTLTLSCDGSGGSASDSVTLVVAAPPSPSAHLTSSATTAFVGESVLLTWSAGNATTCVAGGAWTGPRPVSGSETVVAANPGAQLYLLTCGGPLETARDSVTVRVSSPSLPLTNLFSPNSVTIATSEGSPYGDADVYTIDDYDQFNLGYGPTRIIRLYVCLNGRIPFWACSTAAPPTGPLPAQLLAAIRTGIASYAHTGIRLLIRFIYNFGPAGAEDVPVSLIATHLDQLAPILLEQRDLIFALEAGFIGAWGEWHSSTSFNDSPEARKTVLDRELSSFGGVFPILVRYPADLLTYTRTATPTPGLGLHDDYYASSPDDGSTWSPRAGWLASELRTYGAAVGTVAPFVGEFGALDLPRQSCAAVEQYSYQLHLQSLSLNIFPKAVGANLQAEGCALSFLNRVGTRIELRSVTVQGTPAPGGRLQLFVSLVNAGFGRVMRPRPATLVLSAGAGVLQRTDIPLGQLDLRSLVSAANPVPTLFQFEVTLPDTLPDQLLSLSLLLPDPAPSLAGEAAYALPLNSLGSDRRPVFDPVTGLNALATFAPRGYLPGPLPAPTPRVVAP